MPNSLNSSSVPRVPGVPWVESPQFKSELKSSSLPEETKRIGQHLAEHGYAIFDPEVEAFDHLASQIIENLADRYSADGRMTNAWEYLPEVKKLALHSKVLLLLETLYGRSPIPYQTLNFNKGTQQKTHSDTMHFNSVPARFMCGVWIALEDIDENNGPLHYFDGSHRLPIFSPDDLGLPESLSVHERYAAYEMFLQEYLANSGLPYRQVNLKKGQAFIWTANLFHGGSPIKDPKRSRHTQVTHYFFEGCRYYAPVQSNPFAGKIQFLHFRDICSGKKVKQCDLPLLNFNFLTSRHSFQKLRNTLGVLKSKVSS